MFIHVAGYDVGIMCVEVVFELWVWIGGLFKVMLNGAVQFVREVSRLLVAKCGGVSGVAVDRDLYSGMHVVDVTPI